MSNSPFGIGQHYFVNETIMNLTEMVIVVILKKHSEKKAISKKSIDLKTKLCVIFILHLPKRVYKF